MIFSERFAAWFALLPLLGCSTSEPPAAQVKGDKADSSLTAIFYEFEFDGELEVNATHTPKRDVEDQLLFTIGQLNGERGVSRLDKAEIDIHGIDDLDNGDVRVRYHVKMPVAWAAANGEIDSYTFVLPRNITYEVSEEFTSTYSETCVERGAYGVTWQDMWYYYRPFESGCELAPEDIVTIEATATPSPHTTTGKFPEYHKIWEDDVFKVVAIFGKYEAGNTHDDVGIDTYDSMAIKVRKHFDDLGISYATDPEYIPVTPGAAYPDITFSAELPDGRRVEIVLLLVDGVQDAGPEFDARYESLTPSADLIVYAGHSGLGANIRALAEKGKWATGQYSIVIMNGCDTYSYLDDSLAEAHTAVNDDDPNGTKYLDVVTNAMPAFFSSNAENTMAFVRGLMNYEEPKTYEQIFEGVDSYQLQLVSGEEDNVYIPGMEDPKEPNPEDPVESWQGIKAKEGMFAAEQRRYETPVLAAGSYMFAITGTGDVDLHVRMGEAPTLLNYDCRPYRNDSNEVCLVDLPSPGKIHVLLRAAAKGTVEFVASQL